MNRCIYGIGLVSLSTITGLFTLAPKVTAQTVNSGQVEMTATVNGLCLFENELDGTLGVDPADLATLDALKTFDFCADVSPASLYNFDFHAVVLNSSILKYRK